MDKKDLPIFPLISALAGYRLIVADEKQLPGLKDTDIVISKSLYNKMKALCPNAFDIPENIYERINKK